MNAKLYKVYTIDDTYLYYLIDNFPKSEGNNIVGKILSTSLKIPLNVLNSKYNDKDFSKWYLEDDDSVKGDNGYSVEITSSVMDYNTCMKRIQHIFSWMKNKAFTNSTCGFHVNIGFPGKEINKVKLLAFADEDYLYKLANRKYNSKIVDSRNPLTLRNIDEIEDEVHEWIDDAPRATLINFKTYEDGYIEFRVLGGANYEKNFQNIKNQIDRFVALLQIASNPTAYQQDYYKKLLKMFPKKENENTDIVSRNAIKFLQLHNITLDNIKSRSNTLVFLIFNIIKENKKLPPSLIMKYLIKLCNNGDISNGLFFNSFNDLIQSDHVLDSDFIFIYKTIEYFSKFINFTLEDMLNNGSYDLVSIITHFEPDIFSKIAQSKYWNTTSDMRKSYVLSSIVDNVNIKNVVDMIIKEKLNLDDRDYVDIATANIDQFKRLYQYQIPSIETLRQIVINKVDEREYPEDNDNIKEIIEYVDFILSVVKNKEPDYMSIFRYLKYLPKKLLSEFKFTQAERKLIHKKG